MKRQFPFLAITFVLCALVGASLAHPQETALTPQNPLRLDLKERSVSILAEVNGKHPEPTHHGVVFKAGKLAHKAIFASFVDPKTFYESLVSVGFKPGNNMTMDNMEKTFVEGELLEVSVTWKDARKTYRLDEVIRDSNGKPFAIRFGGNLKEALKRKTGCLLCLESCPVGITSNAAYTYGMIDIRKEVVFRSNKGLLPPDGALVTLTFKAKR